MFCRPMTRLLIRLFQRWLWHLRTQEAALLLIAYLTLQAVLLSHIQAQTTPIPFWERRRQIGNQTLHRLPSAGTMRCQNLLPVRWAERGHGLVRLFLVRDSTHGIFFLRLGGGLRLTSILVMLLLGWHLALVPVIQHFSMTQVHLNAGLFLLGLILQKYGHITSLQMAGHYTSMSFRSTLMAIWLK